MLKTSNYCENRYNINREIDNFEKLSKEREKELVDLIKKGDEQAKLELFYLCLKYLRKYVKKYKLKQDDEDLFQLAAERLWVMIQNIHKFNTKKGLRFMYYVSYYIRNEVTKEKYRNKNIIYIPYDVQKLMRKIGKIESSLAIKLEKTPSKEELAKELDISVEQLNNIKRLEDEYVSYNGDDSNDNINYDEIYISSFDGKMSIEDMYEAKERQLELQKTFEKIMDISIPKYKLNEKDKIIITKRYGLIDQIPRTYVEIAKDLNYSPQNIQQRTKVIMKKLKHPKRIRELERFR